MYLKIGRSESRGETSPKSDLKGAPNRCRAVGEFNSVISNLVCWAISSRFRSAGGVSLQSLHYFSGLQDVPTMLLLSGQDLSILQQGFSSYWASICCHRGSRFRFFCSCRSADLLRVACRGEKRWIFCMLTKQPSEDTDTGGFRGSLFATRKMWLWLW